VALGEQVLDLAGVGQLEQALVDVAVERLRDALAAAGGVVEAAGGAVLVVPPDPVPQAARARLRTRAAPTILLVTRIPDIWVLKR
jgi:hypothetical protein